ncbi:hypothetical protein AGABI2DRAFT_194159 [Agaricus bisporus var. bisporus H97]|uniref:hypothetical protein n=1 Tax=Agaricus bisporus var. bisporus (strain H97 / ATCC MYA-4626 / FGSC 10389) TaxID=936046 RepID=UPI00029F6C0B|nr:hypothetical protein AGABI2DRAFT_194159 [Agaricus bisporus var. bisporus H97]EKV45140.1 hypothetical protein AGABI2DRAFT_194159 [Agaricus bisporus var. bisporus H97]
MLSVVDAAGVGKSAIMQDVTGSPISVLLHSSVLFSVDGTKAIITLSYRLAVKSKSYCQFITREIERDPSLVESSISIQFNEFITELFIHYLDLNSAGRALIIFDGLDECNGPHTARFPPPHL